MSPNARRSRRIARSVRDFTVPSGRPVRSAIRLCERPSKYMNSSTSRCSFGNWASASRTSRRSPGKLNRSTTSSESIRHLLHRGGHHVVRPATLRLLASDGVHRSMVHHPHEPRAHRTAVLLEPLGMAPYREESLLHDLLGEVRLPDHAEGERLRRRPVAAEEAAESLLVSSFDPVDQHQVLGVRALRRHQGRPPLSRGVPEGDRPSTHVSGTIRTREGGG